MPTTVTKTIGSAGGRDYPTLVLWEGGLPADLTAGGTDTVQIGQCFNDGEFTSASNLLTLSGHTTDATHTITLTTGSGQGFKDNVNAQTNLFNYNAANGVGIRLSGSYDSAITGSDNNIILSNLQVKGSGGTSSQAVSLSGSGPQTINGCILVTNAAPASLTGGNGSVVANSLLLQVASSATAIVRWGDCTGGVSVYFCDLVCPSNIAVKPTNAISAAYGTITLKNCGFFGATGVKGGSATPTYTNCMTDIVGPPAGITGSKTYANQFNDTTIASGDYSEKVGADLQAAGAATGTAYDTPDAVGSPRPQGGSNFDIGAWELRVAGGTVPPIPVPAVGGPFAHP